MDFDGVVGVLVPFPAARRGAAGVSVAGTAKATRHSGVPRARLPAPRAVASGNGR
jgi:hypothetical protein